jgi:predicted MPP superfamily phosphohydrolase
MLIEPRWLQTRVTDLSLPGPQFSSVLTILQLSDLHCTSVSSFSLISDAIDLGLQHKPDLVCLTGDFITAGRPRMWDRYPDLLHLLATRAPAYAVLGNHDGGKWSGRIGGLASTGPAIEMLGRAGIHVLHNTSTVVQAGGCCLNLVGIGDLQSAEVDPHAAFTDVPANSDVATVVLAHNPDTKDLLGAYPWELMLSGHTHGGQVVLLGLGAPFSSVHDRRYIAGLRPWRGRWIHVSRGVGSLFGVRFNCPPEVNILRIRWRPTRGTVLSG